MNHRMLRVVCGILIASLVSSARAESVIPVPPLGEVVLFPFDSWSLPYRHGVELTLISGSKKGIVLDRGPKGAPDSARIDYYGTVIRIGEKLHMWYRGSSEQQPRYFRICYATSDDGIKWERPNLGLVEFSGNKNNNLVDLDLGSTIGFAVLHDPDDPDPNRRFKLFAESAPPKLYGHVAYSPDGLHWKPSPNNPVVKALVEPSGLIKRDGLYYVNLQGIGWPRRVLLTLASPDFEHWSDAPALGFRRDALPPRPMLTGSSLGPQVHIGAALWDRGNVVIGLYGQWNGPQNSESNDRRLLRMNLGLLVSPDALHFSEPIPDFHFVDAGEEDWAQTDSLGAPPCLTQGQGMFNVGDRTITWYGIWGYRNWAIRAVTWQRDRLGYFQPKRDPIEGSTWVGEPTRPDEIPPNLVSAPIELKKPGAKIFVNADGLSDQTNLTVELLDKGFQLIKDFSGDNVVALRESGLRQPIRFKSGDSLPAFEQPVRVRINYRGARLEDAKVYAVYVDAGAAKS